MSPVSFTRWLSDLRAGDRSAVQQLWDRYFGQMVRLARQRLKDHPCRVADEEDVALSAFDSFCRGAEQGRFLQLHDWEDLWGLLIAITTHKAWDLVRREARQKRAGTAEELDLDQFLSSEPTPEFAAEVADEYRRFLSRLGNTDLKVVALWKLEGYTNDEIAVRLGCVSRTVERKLQVIRSLWNSDG